MRDPIKAGFVALVLFLSLAVSVAAGPFEDGAAALKHGDYATALRLFRPLANQGDAHTQVMLGIIYDHALGVPQNYAAAMRWYRKAADQGDAHAQSALGRLYRNGEGVPRDYGLAAKWYRKAADQGNAHAQSPSGGCTPAAKACRRITPRR
jgi:hypothetical protein